MQSRMQSKEIRGTHRCGQENSVFAGHDETWLTSTDFIACYEWMVPDSKVPTQSQTALTYQSARFPRKKRH